MADTLANKRFVSTAHAEDRPRVLYLTKIDPYPPAVAGDAVYSRGVIGALAPLTHLTVLCSSNGASTRAADAAAADWHIVEAPRTGLSGSIFSSWPSIVWRGNTPGYKAELERLLHQAWDAIILDNIGTAHAMPAVLKYKTQYPTTALVYVSHEMEFDTRRAKYRKYRLKPIVRLASFVDLIKVRATERMLIQKTDITTVINEGDVAGFRAISPKQRYLLLSPGYDGKVLQSRTIGPATPRRIALLGGRTSQQKQQILLDWLDAAYEPLSAAEVEIIVLGEIAPGLSNLIQKQYPKVRLLGFVEDTDDILAECRMGIVPDTVGGGFKLRLLTYVFRRVPIVGLDQAISGLPTEPGTGYLATSSLPALVDLILKTIDQLDVLNATHEQCFLDCTGIFTWEARGETLIPVLRSTPLTANQGEIDLT